MAVQKTPRTGLETYTDGSDPHPNRSKFNSERSLLDALVALAAQGVTGARPSPGIVNRLYWDTTVKRLYWDDGTAWNEITTNGGGGAGQPITPGATATEGSSARSARADHTHLLALATAAVDGAMSKGDKAKLDAASSTPTANTLVMLDANGRTQVANPAAASDAANKGYVDTQTGTRAPLVHAHDAADTTSGVFVPARIPAATPTAQGAMPAADKAKLDAATAAATPNTLMLLDANGRAQVAAPATAGEIATKGYVDGLAVNYAPAAHTHPWADITGKPSTFAPSAHTHPWAEVTDKPAVFPPAGHSHNGADITSGLIDVARIPSASATAEGTMSAADKKKLDAASSSSAANTLMMTDGNGRFQAVAPSAAADVANKSYVDNKTWSGADITTGTISVARIPSASATAEGTMSAADKKKLDSASSTPTANTLVMLDGNGRTQIATPVGVNDAANKSYVDGRINTCADANHTHTWNSITGKPATYPATTGYVSGTAKPGEWRPKWGDIDEKPSTYTPSSHTHSWGNISGGGDRMNWGSTFTQLTPPGSGHITVYNGGKVQMPGAYSESIDGTSWRAVWANQSGYLGYNLSSRKYKTNERTYAPDAALLDAVEPKWYQLKTDVADNGTEKAIWRVNFIAEDLHNAGLTEYVSYDGKGTEEANAETINEQLIVNALWAFAKQQRDQIADLTARVEALEPGA
jgi:hypothetical protein